MDTIRQRSAIIAGWREELRELAASLEDDTLTVASHASAHGWIRAAMLPEIRGEKLADEGDGARRAPAPTVVVGQDVGAGDLE